MKINENINKQTNYLNPGPIQWNCLVEVGQSLVYRSIDKLP